MRDLNVRIKQLTNLILMSQTVHENRGDKLRPASPYKEDFDMTLSMPRPLSFFVPRPHHFYHLPLSCSHPCTHPHMKMVSCHNSVCVCISFLINRTPFPSN